MKQMEWKIGEFASRPSAVSLNSLYLYLLTQKKVGKLQKFTIFIYVCTYSNRIVITSMDMGTQIGLLI